MVDIPGIYWLGPIGTFSSIPRYVMSFFGAVGMHMNVVFGTTFIGPTSVHVQVSGLCFGGQGASQFHTVGVGEQMYDYYSALAHLIDDRPTAVTLSQNTFFFNGQSWTKIVVCIIFHFQQAIRYILYPSVIDQMAKFYLDACL